MLTENEENSEKSSNTRLLQTGERVWMWLRDRAGWLTARPERGADLYFAVLLLLAAFYLFRWPIVAFDTDLWTHLNGGRYFFEQGKIPRTSFYSFVTPEREILSYSWLFKIVIYQIYSLSGYGGIILVRTLVCLSTLAIIYLYLRRSSSGIRLMLFFLLYFMLFIDIGSDQRPYNISFLLIALFLYVIEHHPRKAWLLPPLAVLWVNIHGVEYPVMVLILSAYLMVYVHERWLKRTGTPERPKGYPAALALAMLAVFVSPNGFTLLQVPFTETSYASQYIKELRPIVFDDIFSFRLHGMVPEFKTAANLFFFVSLICVLLTVAVRRVQLHHLLLFFGGVFLLTKGVRFVHEFALLALPCIRLPQRCARQETAVAVRNAVLAVVTVFLLAAPFLYLGSLYGNRPKYPLAADGLPAGTAAFFERIDTGGSLLNDPAVGGYLGWRLWPDYHIYMDMQVPFLFTDSDIFMGINALYNKKGFKRFVAGLQPDYVAAPSDSPLHNSVLEHSQTYVPVFFDDRTIVYVDRHRHPEIADRYRLAYIRPVLEDYRSLANLNAEEARGFLQEAQRIVEIDPGGFLINRMLAGYYRHNQSFAEASRHAGRLIENFPDRADGYRQMGEILRQRQSYAEALRYYRKALDRPDGTSQADLHKAMWACHFALQQYRAAYRSLKQALNFFSPRVDATDLYRIAQTAYRVGRFEEARMLAEFAAFKTAQKGPRQEAEISNLLNNLE